MVSEARSGDAVVPTTWDAVTGVVVEGRDLMKIGRNVRDAG
jgi:hypothetical protein